MKLKHGSGAVCLVYWAVWAYHPRVSVAARGPLLGLLPHRSPLLARSRHPGAGMPRPPLCGVWRWSPSVVADGGRLSQPAAGDLAWSWSRPCMGACSGWSGDQQGCRHWQCHDHHLLVLAAVAACIAAALRIGIASCAIVRSQTMYSGTRQKQFVAFHILSTDPTGDLSISYRLSYMLIFKCLVLFTGEPAVCM